MAKQKRKRRFLDRLVFFFNSLAALALLLSYLAYYVNPAHLTFFAFMGLGYFIILLLNIGFIIYWIFRFKSKFLLSLICIGIGYFHLGRTYRFGSPHKVVNAGERLKVMSYNVRMFNAYEWITEEDIPAEIKKMVHEKDPDVLLIQEFHKASHTPDLGFKYDYKKYTNDGNNYGLTIYSKFPIVKAESISYSQQITDNDELIYADILWKGDTIRFINVHLASIGLAPDDYNRLRNPNEGSQEEIKRGFLKITQRIHLAFQERGEQVAVVRKVIQASPYPVILCGDFNDTPQSYTYHQIDLLLQDAYMVSGSGFSKTYSRGPLPFRIDHIFHSDDLRSSDFEVVYRKLSDHYPVMAEFEVR